MPISDCPGCLRLEASVLDLMRRLSALERRLAALEQGARAMAAAMAATSRERCR